MSVARLVSLDLISRLSVIYGYLLPYVRPIARLVLWVATAVNGLSGHGCLG